MIVGNPGRTIPKVGILITLRWDLTEMTMEWILTVSLVVESVDSVLMPPRVFADRIPLEVQFDISYENHPLFQPTAPRLAPITKTPNTARTGRMYDP